VSRLQYLSSIRPGDLSVARVRDALARRVREVPHRLAWETSSEARLMRIRLGAFRDRHRGERCFVVANGPSLGEMDLSPLVGEATFGMNRIYRLAEDGGFQPTYLACVDIDSQLEQIHAELENVNIPKFLNWNARHLFDRKNPSNHFLKLTFKPRFALDPTRTAWGGHSVTNVCLQLAYYFGFAEVILIGKDHSYREQGDPGEVRTSTGDEQNHFMPGYYARGATWRIPDYLGEELAYSMARAAFERDGRRIVDATVGGELDVFEKVDYGTLF
jgi:hypothetical protein